MEQWTMTGPEQRDQRPWTTRLRRTLVLDGDIGEPFDKTLKSVKYCHVELWYAQVTRYSLSNDISIV
jgi:hypothetical protein